MSDNSPQEDELVQNFCSVTGADVQQARHFLEASNWNIASATEQFYENDEPMVDDEDDMDLYEPPPQQAASSSRGSREPAASSSSKAKSKARGNSKFATLGDLKANDDDDDDSGDEKPQDFFAGGEKSGLAVQNPGDGKKNIIQDILKRATEGGQQRHAHDQEEAGPSRPRFSGTGYTLGNEETPSTVIPDPSAPSVPAVETVTRSLTFWRDGFSVEDGPLMRYDDPENEEVLAAIRSGRAPLSLMNLEHGQPADVNVFRRMDEDYVQPKKKQVPFGGQGNRLGSPTSGTEASPSSSAPPPAAAAPAPAAAATQPQPSVPAVEIDPSVPSTTLQIRLGDGTRLVSRFNHTHTVGDVYGFVNAASLESRSRDYVLQTTFPNKELKEFGQSVKEAGLVNAVIVQKWC